MEQAQRLTRDLQGRQEELGRREVEAQSGAGLVTAVMNGRGDLLRLRIDPKLFARIASDQALIEDLIVAAVNGALGEVHKLQQTELSSLAAPFGGNLGQGGKPA
jgi:DNA-binding YbaB/EbfC family protein